MSIFETLGQRVERVKQQFTDDPDYRCHSCGRGLDDDAGTCPRCGSNEIVPVE